MGWGNCGEDREGRPIGYYADAKCDHPRCEKTIDRGLAYACGDMHGESEYSCEKYFCEDHMGFIFIKCVAGTDGATVCFECQESWDKEHVKDCKRCADALER